MIAAVRFAGDLHPGLVIGLALAAALLVAWFYLRETKHIPAPYNYLLPGVRGSVIALAILILAGPVWHRRQTIGTLGRVMFAIDRSASMSLTDSISTDSTPTRLTRASRLLVGSDSVEGWLSRLGSTHLVDVVAFSAGSPVTLWSSQSENERPLSLDLTADGASTDLGSPIQMATQTEANQGPTALVLLTEGRDNSGTSPADAAAKANSAGLTVHTIGIGSIDEPTDIGIVRVNHPVNTSTDAPLVGAIQLRQSGLLDTGTTVTIKHRDKVVWQQTVTMTGTELTLPFEIDLAPIVEQISSSVPRGVQRRIAVVDLLATVESTGGEVRQENNSRPFRVAASTSEHRLLILDGSSRWEMRYVRNLFSRSPEWTVDTLLVGVGTDMPSLIRGDLAGQFPNSAESISRYDAIILGEIPPQQWTQSDTSLLSEFVARGGGLIVIDGRYGRIKSLVEQSLADLVPISYLDPQRVIVRTVRPTDRASDYGAFDIWDNRAEQDEFWQRLPAPPEAPNVRAPLGSETLAEVVDSDGQTMPWITTRMFGAGRVFYLSTDQTWRWRYKVADRFHSRFWNQLMIAAIQPPYSAGDSFLALGTDKVEYRRGDSATIRARLRSAAGQPIGDSTVEALLVASNQIVARIPLESDDPSRGTYRGVSGPLDLGDYAVRIRASGISQASLQATTPIWVTDEDSGELSRVSLDEQTLQQIADQGGGTYWHESAAQKLVDELIPLSTGQIVESDVLIWQSYYWFIAIMFLLTVEWVMRKRAGLI